MLIAPILPQCTGVEERATPKSAKSYCSQVTSAVTYAKACNSASTRARNNSLLLGLVDNQGGTKEDIISRERLKVWRIKTPSSIRVSVELKWAGTGEEQAAINSATKISKDAKEITVVDTGGGGHELTQDVKDIRNVRTSDAEIDKAIDKVTIASGLLKRDTICGTKTSMKLHRSVHRTVISMTNTIKKVMNVLSLG
jgi:hypothetical protein